LTVACPSGQAKMCVDRVTSTSDQRRAAGGRGEAGAGTSKAACVSVPSDVVTDV
jgi:hypothetical protein